MFSMNASTFADNRDLMHPNDLISPKTIPGFKVYQASNGSVVKLTDVMKKFKPQIEHHNKKESYIAFIAFVNVKHFYDSDKQLFNFNFLKIKGKVEPVVPTYYVDILSKTEKGPVEKKILDITYPEGYEETPELLVAKNSYIRCATRKETEMQLMMMEFTQKQMEMENQSLRKQLEEMQLSYNARIDSSNEFIRRLNEKHEEQNAKKIIKIAELEDKIVVLEETNYTLKNGLFCDNGMHKHLFEMEKSVTERLKKEVTNLNKGISRKTAAFAEISSENEKLKRERDGLEIKNIELKKNVTGVSKTVEKLKQENSKLKAEKETLSSNEKEISTCPATTALSAWKLTTLTSATDAA
ncbi:Oidioi.mRNA.OKI2018_I69.PAR.g11436.t1.cds [Oikopleura dioica]|uniref:Oidioi.mRNA.OKI2018_I69.PAR.g11436.t1.cds n=1 Tax=Oikopleura dioica TaxID=34765 RepID=A0ABN7S1E1_OIKDI|nr:Oidioi.mRNA.OKI2018_I69.PAR.g11436.t1.cds [Oikopleura dioica]